MNKFKALVIALGLSVMGVVANAQTLIDTNALPGNQATGTYHVTLTQTGNHMNVLVYGNNDGSFAKTGVHKIQIVFTDWLGNEIVYLPGGTGSTTAGGGHNAHVWVFNPVLSFQYNAGANPLDWIAPKGGNLFTGDFDLSSANIARVQVNLSDTNQQWLIESQLTPEMSSIGLLLPGLMSLGMSVRRRRKRA